MAHARLGQANLMHTLASFVAHLAALTIEVEHEAHHALERAAIIVETEAKDSMGEYQVAAGPFAAWAELADATKADRVAQGFPENEPELRTGGLRDSIQHQVRISGAGGEAHVGSDSQIMVYQELGTSRMPPRSILGGAAFRKADEVRDVVGGGVVAVIEGRRAI